MCRVLKISRQTYYNYINNFNTEPLIDYKLQMIEDLIEYYWKESKGSYGTRSYKAKLRKHNLQVSRRKISTIMHKLGISSSYQTKKFKYHATGVNNDDISNLLEQNFNNYGINQVLTSDLTYVKVNERHNYVCFIIDLYNRQIIGYSVGIHKTADLVLTAFNNITIPLKHVAIFHTDRGMEFKNSKIDELLDYYSITRSLSKKGNPYDNAVSESTFKTFKTTWVKKQSYNSYQELIIDVTNFVKWYNEDRPHSALNYLSPIEFKQNQLAA